jgi:hypothetical protein
MITWERLPGECQPHITLICLETQFDFQLHIPFSLGNFLFIFCLFYHHVYITYRLEYFQVYLITFWMAWFLFLYNYIMDNLWLLLKLLNLISHLHTRLSVLNMNGRYIISILNFETTGTSFSWKVFFPLFRKVRSVKNIKWIYPLNYHTVPNCNDEEQLILVKSNSILIYLGTNQVYKNTGEVKDW